jgi:hypothetical protein
MNELVEDLALEAVELELALQLQDVVADGFADSVQEAVETAGYRYLFQMPAVDGAGTEQIAAICTGRGESRRILLVHLDADGRTVRVSPADDDETAYAEIADSFAQVLEELEGVSLAA